MKKVYFSLLFILFASPITEGYCQLSKGFESFYLDAYQDLQNQNYSSLIEKVKNFEIKKNSLSTDEKFYVYVLYYGAYTGLSDNSNNIKNYQSLKFLVDSEKFKTVDKKTIEQVLSQYELILSQSNTSTEPESINKKDAPPNIEINENRNPNEKIATSTDSGQGKSVDAPANVEISENRNPNEKVATLTVSGQGKSVDEAKNIALRSALELAFGTFISSKTEIFNDELIGDEIVSLTSGNIQNYKINSQAILPDGRYTVSLTATVSISKFTSFVESKGIVVEFKGGLFAENIKIQKLNEEAEYKAILNLCEVSDNLLKKSLDFKLDVKEPKIAGSDADKYELQLIVSALPNDNFDSFKKYFLETIKNIGMNDSELTNYKKINKAIFTLNVDPDLKFENNNKSSGLNNLNPTQLDYYLPTKDLWYDLDRKSKLVPERGNSSYGYKFIGDLIHLRSQQSSIALQNLFLKSNQYLSLFKINFIGLEPADSVISEMPPSHNTWNLNTSFNEWESLGFPNFRFQNPSYGTYRESYSSWYIYINHLSFFSNYWGEGKDLTIFLGKEKYYSYTGSNDLFRLDYPFSLYPSANSYQPNQNGSEYFNPIGKINFVKKLYFNERTYLIDLNTLEKITSITIEGID